MNFYNKTTKLKEIIHLINLNVKSISNILFFYFFICSFSGISQDSIKHSISPVNRSRLIGVSIGQGSLIGLSGVGLHSLWYSNKESSKFHFLMILEIGKAWIKWDIYTLPIKCQNLHHSYLNGLE